MRENIYTSITAAVGFYTCEKQTKMTKISFNLSCFLPCLVVVVSLSMHLKAIDAFNAILVSRSQTNCHPSSQAENSMRGSFNGEEP